ncbi:MAG: hypothetical protein AB7I09_15455 [Planctomycetota bacterium]
MVRTVLAQELRQHGVFLLGLLVVNGLAFVGLVAWIRTRGVDAFGALTPASMTVTLCTLSILCSRLFVREHAADVCRFLAGLPVSWAAVALIKWLVGFTCAIAIAALEVALAAASEAARSNLPSGLVGTALVHVISFVGFMYCFFAGAAQLGRYRVTVYLGVFLILQGLSLAGLLPWAELWPLRLVNERLASQVTLDRSALAWTWGLTGVLSATTLSLALWDRGGLVSGLASRMSHREKVFVAMGVIGAAYGLTLVEDPAKGREFSVPGGAVFAPAPGVRVEISPSHVDDGGLGPLRDDTELGQFLAAELDDLRVFLGWERTLPVFLGLARNLDGDEVEATRYDEINGVFVNANWTSDRWRPEQLVRVVVREQLLARSSGALDSEDSAWVLAGFAQVWPMRKLLGEGSAAPEWLRARAFHGTRRGCHSAELFGRWRRVVAQHGEPIAAAVAASWLIAMAGDGGEATTRAFLQQALAPEVPRDLRALVKRARVGPLLARTFGLDEREFDAKWRRLLNQWGERQVPIPELQADLRSDATGALSCRHLVVPGERSNETTEVLGPVSVVFARAGLWRRLPRAPETQQVILAGPGEWTPLHAPFGRGDRVCWTVSAYSSVTDCEVISGWEWSEVGW